MNEVDLLNYFYDELKIQKKTRDTLFITLDQSVASKLTQKLGSEVSVDELYYYADICIANEWLERTTIDPGYRYLSMTSVGLQIAIAYQYRRK